MLCGCPPSIPAKIIGKEIRINIIVISIRDNFWENWGWLKSNSYEQLRLRPQCTTNLVLSKKRWISVVRVFGGLMTRTSIANAGAEDTKDIDRDFYQSMVIINDRGIYHQILGDRI